MYECYLLFILLVGSRKILKVLTMCEENVHTCGVSYLTMDKARLHEHQSNRSHL
jgi:hypothetical protein